MSLPLSYSTVSSRDSPCPFIRPRSRCLRTKTCRREFGSRNFNRKMNWFVQLSPELSNASEMPRSLREVQLDDLSTNEWVLIFSYQRNKFEPKHLGPLQVTGRGALDTFRLRDVEYKPLKAMVHSARLNQVATGSDTTTWWFKLSRKKTSR